MCEGPCKKQPESAKEILNCHHEGANHEHAEDCECHQEDSNHTCQCKKEQ